MRHVRHRRPGPHAAYAASAATALVLLTSSSVTIAGTHSTASFSGRTPSGGRYDLTAHVASAGGLCERLRLGSSNDEADSSHCQPPHGDGAHGLWDLNCRTGDLAIYGTAYSTNASISFIADTHQPVGGHRRRVGRRQVFLLVVGKHDLPGRFRVRTTDGRTLKTLSFGTPKELCATSAGGSPLDAGYDF